MRAVCSTNSSRLKQRTSSKLCSSDSSLILDRLIPVLKRSIKVTRLTSIIIGSISLLGSFQLLADPINPIAPQQWRWQIDTAGYAESKVSIYIGEERIISYLIECNLENNQSDGSDEQSQIAKVVSNNNNYGLLLITCTVGAHSKLVQIYNPINESSEPVFSKVGSYQAGWKVEEHQLFVFYDEPCSENKHNNDVTCDQYQQVLKKWPNLNKH